jgi:hypothetical protein
VRREACYELFANEGEHPILKYSVKKRKINLLGLIMLYSLELEIFPMKL